MKKCPFCASEETGIASWQVFNGQQKHTEYAVSCSNCGALGPNDLSEKRAIQMWNMRREKMPQDEQGKV